MLLRAHRIEKTPPPTSETGRAALRTFVIAHKLGRSRDRAAFDCGHASVTSFLQKTALQAQELMRAATKVAVLPAAPASILGYFILIAIKIVDHASGRSGEEIQDFEALSAAQQRFYLPNLESTATRREPALARFC